MKRLPIVYANDTSGKQYWRSLGEHAGAPATRERIEREFPDDVAEPPPSFSRRGFLGVMGASMALASLSGCRRPEEKILPYAHAPEEVVPGKPMYFATSFALQGTAFGLVVESHEGRPTKIEGNPLHPESLGATTTWAQASVLDLYDPDRSASPREHGFVRSADELAAALRAVSTSARKAGGAGLAILTEAHRSPTLKLALADLQRALPSAKVFRYEPFSRQNVREGARLAFGKPFETVRDLSRADVVVSLDADLLHQDGSPVKQARGFAAGRAGERIGAKMNRLYVVESGHSITGANADHRLRMQSREIAGFAFALANELATAHKLELPADVAAACAARAKVAGDKAAKWVKAVARDLASKRGASVLAAGDRQPAAVHAVVHLVNLALGNVGATVAHVAPFDDASDGPEGVLELAKLANAGKLETLVIIGGNPAFDAPADADFARAMQKVKTSIHLSTHVDETSSLATWHVNRAHFLEAWSDTRSEDGTAAIVQPLIAPLHGGRTDAELVSMLLGEARKPYELVRATWAGLLAGSTDFEKAWRRALHDGLIAGTASPRETPAVDASALAAAIGAVKPATDGIELVFGPDSHAYDGRFANNGWLQELPDSMHKVTWTNVAQVSPATAKELGLSHDPDDKEADLTKADWLEISLGGVNVTLPAVVVPGIADHSIQLGAGQGRRAAGRVGTGVGVDVYRLRSSVASGFVSGARAEKRAPADSRIPRTQEHHLMEGRPLVREATLSEYRKDSHFAAKMVEEAEDISMWPAWEYKGHRWGMAIDLNACIGCAVCTIACQAENNIPVVGPEAVEMSREMHWIRIDRYFEGDPDDPRSVTQPVGCQHCENAPCEQVCPVGATAHSPEGTNDMAYNRCIGTKYCGNNCPFKVRRFNYLNWNKDIPQTEQMQKNPDVTVRFRGVMEKCTFCIQRVNEAKIGAKREGRDRVHDGEITTACQQACPTSAIVFGDLADPSSRVSKATSHPLAYKLLEDLNIRPRVSYLAKVRNPNPEIEPA